MTAAGSPVPLLVGPLQGRLVGGVDDQHVGVGPAGDIAGNRAEHPPEDGAQSHVADHQQIGRDLLGEFHQRIYRSTLNRPLLDVVRPGRLGPVTSRASRKIA